MCAPPVEHALLTPTADVRQQQVLVISLLERQWQPLEESELQQHYQDHQPWHRRRFCQLHWPSGTGIMEIHALQPLSSCTRFGTELNLVDTICSSLTTTTYPLPLLVNGEDGRPHAALMPFSEHTLAGQQLGDKYALVGDVMGQGAMPPLIVVPRTWFHLTAHQAVHAIDRMTALWGGRAANESHLGPATDGTDGATIIRTRHAVPIPHSHADGILSQYNTGQISWRWLWTNVGSGELVEGRVQ